MSLNLVIRRYIAALFAGAVGGMVFYWLRTPMPWMLGAIFGALLATHLPATPVFSPTKLANAARIVMGTAVGSAFTPAILDSLPQYLFSLALLLPLLLLVVGFGLIYFVNVAAFDRKTAFFCSLPGGLIELTMISEAYGADMQRVALSQTSRVLLIVATVPFAIHHWTHVDLSGRTRMSGPLTEFPPEQAVLLLIVVLSGWLLMRRVGLPGASIVGPMICSAFIYSLGWVTVKVPDELINIAQWILGTVIGCAFIDIKFIVAMRAIVVTLGYFVILMIVALIVAVGAHQLTDVPLVATVLAFIPGGQAEMNVIGLTVGVAVPYIALHHIFRMLLVMTIAPPLSAWLFKTKAASNSE